MARDPQQTKIIESIQSISSSEQNKRRLAVRDSRAMVAYTSSNMDVCHDRFARRAYINSPMNVAGSPGAICPWHAVCIRARNQTLTQRLPLQPLAAGARGVRCDLCSNLSALEGLYLIVLFNPKCGSQSFAELLQAR